MENGKPCDKLVNPATGERVPQRQWNGRVTKRKKA
jgi:hypothetical protein